MGIEDLSSKISKPKNAMSQLLRYLVVGGAATLVDMGIATVFSKLLSVDELIASAVGFAFGMVVNFLISILWVFKKSEVTSRTGEFVGFVVIGLIGLALRTGIIALLQVLMDNAFFEEWIFRNFNETLRLGIAVVIVLIYNFTARKLILYREKKPDSGEPDSN